MADTVLVNSNFTAGIFGRTFTRLAARGIRPGVLYPSLDTSLFDGLVGGQRSASDDFIFLSVNRYSRPKNLPLAIRALARLRATTEAKVRLIMVGGYDSRVEENVEHLRELQARIYFHAFFQAEFCGLERSSVVVEAA